MNTLKQQKKWAINIICLLIPMMSIACESSTDNQTTSPESSAGSEAGDQMVDAGDSTQPVAGESAGEMVMAGESAGEMAMAGESAGEMVMAGESAGEMVMAGESAGEMVMAGESAGETVMAGESAGETVMAGESAGEDIIEPTEVGYRDNGQVFSAWDDFCIAEFTSEYTVTDYFGEELFTAEAGSRYIISESDFERRYELLYLTEASAAIFEIEVEDPEDLPLINTCINADLFDTYHAVAKDTTFYIDEELTMEACTLRAGTAAVSSRRGFYLITENLNEPVLTYQIQMGGLASLCGDHEQTYIAVEAYNDGPINGHHVPLQPIFKEITE